MSNTASELARLRAALAAAEVTESELAQIRAVVSCTEAMIQELKLEIAKLRRDKYGISSERRARLIDQLELQLEEPETAAAEDALATEQAAAKANHGARLHAPSPCVQAVPRSPTARAGCCRGASRLHLLWLG